MISSKTILLDKIIQSFGNDCWIRLVKHKHKRNENVYQNLPMPLSLSGKHSEDSFLMLKDDSFLMLSSENSVAKLSNRNFLLLGGPQTGNVVW